MRAVVCDGNVTYITDSDGTSVVNSGDFEFGKADDITVGGDRANKKMSDIIRILRPRSGYRSVVIGSDSLYFTDKPAFLVRLSRPAVSMWRDSFDPASAKTVDDAVKTLMEYGGDEIWDGRPEGSEFLASEYLAAIKTIRDTIAGNIDDTTMRPVVCGRICMYASFRDSMPKYVECIEPVQLSKEIYETFNKTTKGRDKI